MTAYQEILTDPSYAGQIVTFTFPHIGKVGTNNEDMGFPPPTCRGLVLREHITPPASRIRDPKGCLAFAPDGHYDVAHMQRAAAQWPGLVAWT